MNNSKATQRPEAKIETRSCYSCQVYYKNGIEGCNDDCAGCKDNFEKYVRKESERVYRKINVKSSKVVTTPFFWDCDCENDYIHPKSVVVCNFCHAWEEESPDSRLNEVMDMLEQTAEIH